MKKNAVLKLALSMFLFSSCATQINITGSWIQPIPGQENTFQGMELQEGGVATSINMATLRYYQWKREGDHLILSGSSIGNRQTFDFSDTLTIQKLTPDSLILDRKGYKMAFVRK